MLKGSDDIDDENEDEDFAAALDDFIDAYCRDLGPVSTAMLIAALREKTRQLEKGKTE